jgi:hypothetical protein
MEGIKRQVKFFIYDSKKQFITLWVVIILLDLMGYYLNYKYNAGFGISEMISQDSVNGEIITTKYANVAGANILPAMIFLVVYSLMQYGEGFSTAIGFSSTRKDFYRGVIVHNVIICAVMALIETVLLKLDVVILKLLEINPITKISYFDTKADNVIFIFLIIFLQALIFCAFMNLISVLTYKFAAKFWIAAGIVFLVLINMKAANFTLGKLISAAVHYGSFMSFTIRFLLISIAMYILGWIFVRRMDVKPGK